ncbi:MAG: WD40 repeat domain-containing protein, partial [Verrucomicrobia bacterium]|nr:WD40 repeat domain-containing protein [Verrucomicrobiota bacterium]
REAETESPVRALAFSPDNLTLATAGDDRLVHTWSAANGRGFETFGGHRGTVLGLAFIAEDAVASVGADTNGMLWDTESAWVLERTIGTGDASSPLVDRVLAVAFSPDGAWLATGGGVPSRSGELKLWRVADGTLVREFQDAHSDTVFSVSFAADGMHLASGAADKFVKVFDLTDGRLAKTFEGHTGHVLGVSWERNGRVLASCGADKVIKVWNLASGQQQQTIGGFDKEVTSIHFIGASNQMLVSAGDHQVRIVRQDGSRVRRFDAGNDFLESAAITPDGLTVIAGGPAGRLRVWDGGNGRLLQSFDPPKPGVPVRLTRE